MIFKNSTQISKLIYCEIEIGSHIHIFSLMLYFTQNNKIFCL